MPLTYSYRIHPKGTRYPTTVDSGKPTRAEAFADLREYVTEMYGAEHAPKNEMQLREERITVSAKAKGRA